MNVDKQKIRECTRDEARQLFEACGFDFAGKSPGRNGEISGMRLPPSIKGGVDKNPSVSLNLDKMVYKDHGDNIEGDIFDAAQAVMGMDMQEATNWLGDLLGLEGEEARSSARDRAPKKPDLTRSYEKPGEEVDRRVPSDNPIPLSELGGYVSNLLDNPKFARLKKYLIEERGLPEKVLREYYIGARDKYDDGNQWLLYPLWAEEVLIDGEEVTCITHYKEVPFDPKAFDWRRDKNGNKTAITSGSAVLWPLRQLRSSPSGPIVITEGEPDTITLRFLGYNACTGTGGANTWKRSWAKHLASLPAAQRDGVYICYDGDKAGREGAENTASMLEGTGLMVRIVKMPDGEDANSLFTSGREEELSNRLKNAELVQEGSGVDAAPLDESRESELVAALYQYPHHISVVESVLPSGEPFDNMRLGRVYSLICDAWDGQALDKMAIRWGIGDDTLMEQIKSYPVDPDYEGDGQSLMRYARMIQDRSQIDALGNRLVSIGKKLLNGEEGNFDEALSSAFQSIQDGIAQHSSRDLRHIGSYADELRDQVKAWEKGETPDYVRTGFPSLDKRLIGLKRGVMTVFGAPSGTGKTSFLLQVMTNIAVRHMRKGEPLSMVFFSCEMDGKQVTSRIISQMRQLNLQKFRRGRASKEEFEEFRAGIDFLENMPVYVVARRDPTPDYMMSKCLQANAIAPLKFVGLDYLELAETDEYKSSEELRVGAITQGFNKVLKQTNAAGLALSQLNDRHLSNGPSYLPVPKSFRYSKKIYHEAFQAIALHAPWALMEKAEKKSDHPKFGWKGPNDSSVYTMILKNREGAFGGGVEFDWQGETTSFVDPLDASLRNANPESESDIVVAPGSKSSGDGQSRPAAPRPPAPSGEPSGDGMAGDLPDDGAPF